VQVSVVVENILLVFFKGAKQERGGGGGGHSHSPACRVGVERHTATSREATDGDRVHAADGDGDVVCFKSSVDIDGDSAGSDADDFLLLVVDNFRESTCA
jgi:hypothetical protein